MSDFFVIFNYKITNMKFQNQQQENLMCDLEVFDRSEEIENPYSGVSCILCPEAVALYDYIKGCEMYGLKRTFQLAIDLFRFNWPDEYYKLLD